MAVNLLGVVLCELEIKGGERGDRPGDADRGVRANVGRHALREQCAHSFCARIELLARGRIRVEEALSEADATEVEAVVEAEACRPADDEFGGAAADVDHERVGSHVPPERDATEGELRFLVAGEQPRREAVAPLDLAEERFAVLGVANGAGRDRERALGAELLGLAPEVREHVANPRDRCGEEALAVVDALAETRDLEAADNVLEPPVLDVRDEQTSGVGAEIDRRDAHLERLRALGGLALSLFLFARLSLVVCDPLADHLLRPLALGPLLRSHFLVLPLLRQVRPPAT